MNVSIRFEANQFPKVCVHLNTRKDALHVQLDTHTSGSAKPDAVKLVELEVLMRPA